MPDQADCIPATLCQALAERYRLERTLGVGGMATVYLAQDLRHHRLVAIKVLHDFLAETLGIARFLREIDIAAGLTHPHILPLYDSGEADGRLYYVMPFVDGESLRQRLDRERPLPIREAVRILRDIAEALDYADRRGVVHRDLKPANIMLAESHAMVADFGVAKALHAAHGQRAENTGATVLGTPTYMSPEQTTDGVDLDHRADLYSFGVVGYELLTGRPPFGGATTDVLRQHLTVLPVPVTDHRKDIPTALAMIVMRCLEKNPADRVQHAVELLPPLESLLTPAAGQRVVGPVPHRRESDMSQRRRMRQLGVGLGVVAVTAMAATYAFRARRPLPLPTITRQVALTADASMRIDPTLSPDGEYVAYSDGPVGTTRVMVMQVSTRRGIPLTAPMNAPQRFPQWITSGSAVAFLSEGTIWTAAIIGGGRPTLLLRSDSAAPIEDFALSHAGDRVAVVRGGRLSIVWLDGRAPPIALALNSPARPVWSPDDRWIAVANATAEYARSIQQFGNFGMSSLWLFASDGSVRRPLTDSLAAMPQASPVWSGDGRQLYFVSLATGFRDLYVLSLNRAGYPLGRPQRLTAGASPHGLSIARDGRRLVYSAYHVRSAVWRVRIPAYGEAQLEDAERITHELAEIHTLTSSRDNRWLYYDAAHDGAADLYRVRIGSGPPERLTDDPAGDFAPQLSPNGEEIVFQSHRNGTRDLFLLDSAGGRARPLVTGAGHQNYPYWSPDGSMIAYWGSPGIFVIRRDRRGGWSAPEMLHDSLGPPSWTPDGKGLLTYSRLDQIIRLDVATRRLDTLYTRGTAGPRVNRPIMSSDGRTIYFKDRDAVASFWAMPAQGGTPRRVLRFDQRRPSYRLEYWTDGRYLYFTIDERHSDLWLLELARSDRAQAH